MSSAHNDYNNNQGNALITVVTGIDSKGLLAYKNYKVWIVSFATQTQTQFNSSQVQTGIVWSPIRRSAQTIGFSINWPVQTNTVSTVSGVAYTYNGFRAMNDFQNALIFHNHLASSTTISPPPINFLYYNNYTGNYTIPSSSSNIVGNSSNSTYSESNPLVENNLAGLINYNATTSGVYDVSSPLNASLELVPMQYQGWVQEVNKTYDRFESVYSVQYQMLVVSPLMEQVSNFVTGTQVPGMVPNTNTIFNTIPGSLQNWSRANISMNNGININGIPG